MRRALPLSIGLSACLSLTACVGTTGSDLVTFDAAAAGPADAVAGQPLSFVSGRGFEVTLTRATLHVGAVYLNRARPVSGAQEQECILPGIYVAEVAAGIDVDILSPEPQPFPAKGAGTADRAIVGEVWLTHGDVNAEDAPFPVLEIDGTAKKGGIEIPFTGSLSIGENRATLASDPALPSQHPICRERIVSPIPVDLVPGDGGRLILRVDPRAMFVNVDFEKLEAPASDGEPYRFIDDDEGQPSINLYAGLRAREGVYRFIWED